MSTRLIESLKLAADSVCDLFITAENVSRNSRRRRRRNPAMAWNVMLKLFGVA